MSLAAMVWVNDLRNLKPIQYRILMHLADCHNSHTGDCFPSQEKLAEQCEICVRSVRVHLDALEDMGHISRARRVGPEGQCAGTNYRLALENTQPAGFAGWTEGGEEIPHQPADLREPNRQLFAGSNEPGIEPLPPLSPREDIGYLPQRNSGASGRTSATSPNAGTGTMWTGDPKIRQRVVAVAGEDFAKSYIDPATPGPSGEIVARTNYAREKLLSIKALAHLRVIGREELPPPHVVAKPMTKPSYGRIRGG